MSEHIACKVRLAVPGEILTVIRIGEELFIDGGHEIGSRKCLGKRAGASTFQIIAVNDGGQFFLT